MINYDVRIRVLKSPHVVKPTYSIENLPGYSRFDISKLFLATLFEDWTNLDWNGYYK